MTDYKLILFWSIGEVTIEIQVYRSNSLDTLFTIYLIIAKAQIIYCLQTLERNIHLIDLI